jgi:hypothetical protein
MKRFKILAVFLFIVALGIAIWWMRPDEDVGANAPDAQRGEKAPENLPTQPEPRTFPSIAGTAKRARETIAMAQTLNVPIAFWGKVVDQDGTPLVGADVKIHVRHWSLTPTLGTHGSALGFKSRTDSLGIFSISNVTGDVLGIDAITLEGYELSPKTVRAFNYAEGSVANSTNPAVFRCGRNRCSNRFSPLAFRELGFLVMERRFYSISLRERR